MRTFLLASAAAAFLAIPAPSPALAQGSPAFMTHIVPELATSPHAEVRALVAGIAS